MVFSKILVNGVPVTRAGEDKGKISKVNYNGIDSYVVKKERKEGETIVSCEDSAKANFPLLKIFGNLEQKKYNGYSLVDFSSAKGSKDMNVTTNNNEITFSGTTAYYQTFCEFVDITDKLQNGLRYILWQSVTYSEGSTTAGAIYIQLREYYKGTETAHRYMNSAPSAAYFTANTKDYDYVIGIASGPTVGENNNTIKFMVAQNSALPEYEPYTGGIPSPNPQYPQDFKSSDPVELIIRGKNFVNVPESFTWTGVYTFDIGYLPPGEYTFSNESSAGGGTLPPTVGLLVDSKFDKYFQAGQQKQTTVILKGGNYTVGFYSNGLSHPNSAGVMATINKFMLEKSSKASKYEPYVEPQIVDIEDIEDIEIFQGFSLSAIYRYGYRSLFSDSITILNNTVTYTKCIRELILDGTRPWEKSTRTNKFDRFALNLTGYMLKTEPTHEIIASNMFSFGWDKLNGIATNGSCVGIEFSPYGTTTIDEFKAKLSEWYNAGRPAILYFVLPQPLEYDITNTELGQKLLSLRTYDATTIVETRSKTPTSLLVVDYFKKV